jgi:hypothetical protein
MHKKNKAALRIIPSACLVVLYSFVDKGLTNDPFQLMPQEPLDVENYSCAFRLGVSVQHVVYRLNIVLIQSLLGLRQ